MTYAKVKRRALIIGLTFLVISGLGYKLYRVRHTKTIITHYDIETIEQSKPIDIVRIDVSGSKRKRPYFTSDTFDKEKQQSYTLTKITYSLADGQQIQESINMTWSELNESGKLKKSNMKYHEYDTHERMSYVAETWYKDSLKLTDSQFITMYLNPKMITLNQTTKKELTNSKTGMINQTPQPIWTEHDEPLNDIPGTIKIKYRWSSGKHTRRRNISYDIHTKEKE